MGGPTLLQTVQKNELLLDTHTQFLDGVLKELQRKVVGEVIQGKRNNMDFYYCYYYYD